MVLDMDLQENMDVCIVILVMVSLILLITTLNIA
jgi:hypothetical protein